MSPKKPRAARKGRSARALLAENLVHMRRAKKLTQEALAFETGLHRTFIAHVERQALNPSLDNVERLARAFGLEAYELLRPKARVGKSTGGTRVTPAAEPTKRR